MRMAAQILERARYHADVLIANADEKVLGYIARLESQVADLKVYVSEEIDDLVLEVDQVLSDRLNDLAKLEAEFVADTRELVRCSVAESAQTVKQSIADVLNDLGKREPSLTIFGFVVAEVEIQASNIASPIEGWEEMVRAYEEILAEIGENGDMFKAAGIMDEIDRESEIARCFYRENGTSWTRIFLVQMEYRRRSKVWSRLIF